jgi:glycosyltransferase involved in cell wall biosynthesis
LVGRIEKTETLEEENFAWSKTCENIVYAGVSNVVEQYMSAFDCFLLPSYREGFGTGTIEAEAMGVPLIITRIPGPIDGVMEDVTAKVIPKADAEALYVAMKNMPNEDLEKMGAEGYRFVCENFEQEKLFAQIVADRKRLLGIN